MSLDVQRWGRFELDTAFLDRYKKQPVHWRFGALSFIVYKRTYSRDGESWWQTCRRVIEGTLTVQRLHCLDQKLPWDAERARHFAEEAYDRMWRFKWTPPGRGLWIMGTEFLYERGGAALNNCGFVSTKDIADDYASPFCWMFRMAMLGVGVGFDTKGKGRVTISTPAPSAEPFKIGDSREGWAQALERLLSAYAGKATLPARWDYSAIRPRGARLGGFGGVASGPEPLKRMLDDMQALYDSYANHLVDSRLIVDTMNLIGRCVVVGGVRRAAQVGFGEPTDRQFCELKQDKQKVFEYRWASNNSVFCDIGMDYTDIAKLTAHNGEPGYLWLENARAYGRMKDPADFRDEQAEGSNPCVEQTLWDRELCCLVETYPAHHESFEDFCETLKVAYLYAKTVTLVPTGDPQTDAVLERNRRIGCSMTGVVQAINKFGYRKFLQICDRAYAFIQKLDADYSEWLRVPRSIKTTSIKPSGTVSILAGATPGIHWEHAPYYVRRIRVAEDHPLVEMCRRAGYVIEPDAYSESTAVIAFPVSVPNLERCKADVPLREKIDLAAQLQRYWSDNQVSCTAEFDPDEESDELPRILSAYEDRLKAIVFLPSRKHGYEQPPYETITADQYAQMISALKPLEGDLSHEHELEAKFCDGGICDTLP